MWHSFKRNEPDPLLIRIAARAVPTLGRFAQRYAAGALHGDVAIDIGDHHVERWHVPRAERFAELGDIVRTVDAQQRGEPAALILAEPLECHRPRLLLAQRQNFIDDRSVARIANGLRHGLAAFDMDRLSQFACRLRSAIKYKAVAT